ncbi:sulfatase-like hydrolase/transferase [Nitratireductor sp. XY-223]|uniref:sulfatase-like hydrolase/transferase n=1 Tax=Nitratireductor sp. XY-223 TaxID=2561926 RepID=UPI0010AA937B|nr:sulfatase-like hydrolase/transferase [Nitratireductor sp. XY-223]
MPRAIKNILFIMFDQLRYDYLSCAGHATLETPNIDRIAAMGVRFSKAYVQSPICGASRMSFYTGRYVQSHGAAWNNFPLKVGELTLGDHLREIGVETWLVGKTHMKVDQKGLDRLGIASDSIIGARVSECGFDVFERDDGLWAQGPDGFYDTRRSPYNEYLKSKGYASDNPWHDYANSGVDDDGSIASGWFMQHADKPANIREEDSETPYMTGRAIEFMEKMEAEERGPWLCHLSYIKPHWPYIVPEPYHAMYGHNQIQPVVRSERERANPHPVYAAYMDNAIGKAFSRDEVREKVIPAYMGLIKQCDDQIGRLLAYMERSGRIDDTMIVITSDHGDYLGDHWLGEKDLFHEQSVKVPMIIYDPSPEADGARGTVCDALVESIDLAATFVEAEGGRVPDHIIEGRSLMPFLRGEPVDDWREFVISEFDYSATSQAAALGLAPKQARLFMVADRQWKLMHAEGGFRPMLFDLANDPQEFADLGDDPEYSDIVDVMYERLAQWARRVSQRTTISDDTIIRYRGSSSRTGVLLGLYDGSEISPELTDGYRGRARDRYTGIEEDAG